MTLQAESDMAGKMVRCPGCDTKLQIPDLATPPGVPMPSGVDNAWAGEKQHESADESHAYSGPAAAPDRPHRAGWAESDPSNPSTVMSLIIGTIATVAWYAVLYPLGKGTPGSSPSNALDYVHDLFYERTWVNYTEAWFFFWALAMLYLKWQKLRHQRRAFYIDVLPQEISKEINRDNVSEFIDRFYTFPSRLRDSMIVNRLRKSLELFEVGRGNGDVGNMMNAQSNIDSARIGGSYAIVKVFLWAIPILGFIGTVLGLSQAIGAIDLSNTKEVERILASLGNVTSGLGTAFDTTLLGLVLALFLNFPMNALAKAEDDNLNDIDAFCNEVLLPRLNDGGGGNPLAAAIGGEAGAFVEALASAMNKAQEEFLKDLRAVSERISEQAQNLDKRADAHANQVAAEFSKNMTVMRESVTGNMNDMLTRSSDYIRTLATGLQGLNNVLKELGEKQVLIQQVKRKGWFGN